MSTKTTLCHVFEHKGQWYFYDTVTEHLYECDEVIASLIPALDNINNKSTRTVLDERWGSDKVEAAYHEIVELQKTDQALIPKNLNILEDCSDCIDLAAYESEIRQLQLNVTEQCNLRCEYCPYTNGRNDCHTHNKSHMSQETAFAAIDYFLKHNQNAEAPAVSFYGGEPLLRFDLIKQVVARIRERQGDKNIKIYIDTNGVLIVDEVADYLNSEKISLQISLDGPRHIHDRYRVSKKGKGSYDRVIAGVRKFLSSDKDAHKRLRFNAVLAPPYDVKAVVDFFTVFPVYKELGIASTPIVNLNYADLAHIDFQPKKAEIDKNNSLGEDLNDLFDQFVVACQAGEYYQLSYALRSLFDKGIAKYNMRPRQILPDEVTPTATCQPGQRKLHVKANGSYLPCERCGDHMIIGHVETGIDMQMVHTLYNKLFHAVKDRCKTCWAINRCSVCFSHMSASWHKDGNGLVEVPTGQCRSVRRQVEQVFRDYLALKEAGPQAMEWLKDTSLN